MEILYILIPIALVFLALAIRLFMWAVKSGQYDDLNTEGKRILFDEPAAPPKPQGEAAEPQTYNKRKSNKQKP